VFVVLLLSAAPLFGQVTSQRRIPVTKGARPKLARVDTVTIIVHDTVVVHHTDTLSVFPAAAFPVAAVAPPDTTTKACSDRYFPIPIPIPLPRGHSGSAGGDVPGGSISQTTTTPEPATWLLMGTGLAATFAARRVKRARTRREEASSVDDADGR